MTGFTKKVSNHPMLFAQLNGINREGKKFRALSHNHQKSKNGMISLAPETIALGFPQQRTALLSSKPVA